MRTLIAAASLALAVFATPAIAQVSNASMIGNYTVTGTETDGSKYEDGTLAITMDRNGALELKWDGGKYVAIGQVEGTKLQANMPEDQPPAEEKKTPPPNPANPPEVKGAGDSKAGGKEEQKKGNV